MGRHTAHMSHSTDMINVTTEAHMDYWLALCCYDYLENIGFLYPAMSMIVIGLSLLY
jgi:hypothetical protein